MLVVEYHTNGDSKDNIFMNQQIVLQSYNNSAALNLCGAMLTPEILRNIADSIEKSLIELSN